MLGKDKVSFGGKSLKAEQGQLICQVFAILRDNPAVLHVIVIIFQNRTCSDLRKCIDVIGVDRVSDCFKISNQ